MLRNKRKSTLLSLSSHRSLKSLISDPTPHKAQSGDYDSSRKVNSVPLETKSSDVLPLDFSCLDSPLSTLFSAHEMYSGHANSTSSTFSSKNFPPQSSKENGKKSGGKIPRSSHYDNISSFVDEINYLPITNYNSLAEESRELSSFSSAGSSIEEDLELHIVENAIFMTFCLKEADRINKTNVRYWDQLNLDEVLKN